ncbi:MAG TPA: DUF3443 domain-containing protein [Candidatus Acidoferrum sp.]|nr:DUF3443 domain-containing protein [Candidatus Acidoferrum sp.]
MRARLVGMVAALSALAGVVIACGGSKRSQLIASSGQNVAPVAVSNGPTGNYVNGLFASVTVCVPSTSNCQTIPDVLVDTGSTGLRILGTALTISLSPQNASNGNPMAECLPFISGFTWGPVESADVKIAGETATAVPVQVIDESKFPVPTACKNLGVTSLDTLQTLGANGVLGIGLFAQDCGGGCVQTGSSNPGLYYACPAAGCQVTAVPLAQQVQNPVAMFASDNNGIVLQLPAVTAPESGLNGSLVFGIGTQSNNALGGATVYTVDQFGNFTTTYKGTAYSNSFVDSGSNGYFFLSSGATGIPDCSMDTSFYCPASTQKLSATNQGANGGSGSVSFSVANAQSLFANTGASTFNNLGGPGSGGFDWGLPFFFGRNVFVGIEGKTSPGGTGPYWAY